jgi:hypothetical protein
VKANKIHHLAQSSPDPQDSCHVLSVFFACSKHAVLDTKGGPMELAVAFMHFVKDLENALNGSPGGCTSLGNHLLNLCLAPKERDAYK